MIKIVTARPFIGRLTRKWALILLRISVYNLEQFYKKHKETILYVLFGIVTTFTNYAVYFLCKYLFRMSTGLANSFAWIIAVLVAFITNRHYVFRSRSNDFHQLEKEFFGFVGARILTFSVDMAIMLVGIGVLGINDFIIKTFDNIFVLMLNYVISKFFVFKKKEEKTMNETIQSLMNRRSIRKYKQDLVPNEMIETIVQAGLCAPSAMNQQPWHITVIKNKEIISELSDIAKEQFRLSGIEWAQKNGEDPEYSVFHHSPVVIIVSGESGSKYMYGDTANVMENICVAAYSLGLGSCYNGSFVMAFHGERKEELYQKLGIPDGFEPISATSIGYPDEAHPSPRERRKDTVNYVE